MAELRAATIADAEAIASIYAPYAVTNAVSFESKAPTASEMARRIGENATTHPWLVAAEGEVVLGYAYAKPFRPGAPHRFGVEIAVYAGGELEGQGIRRQLLHALIATLTDQNFTQAIVTLLTPNDKLIQLYEAHGFRRAGAYREVCFKNGQWYDIGLWQRDLADAAVPPEELKSIADVGTVLGVSFSLPGFDLDAFVSATLAEDLGPTGRDVTSHSVVPAGTQFSAVMDSRDAIVVAGLPVAAAFFRSLDPEVEIQDVAGEGELVPAGADLMRLSGKARALLTAERSALNTVQHLCGVATLTRAYVDAIAGTGCTLLDTRKTLPGLRVLEKYATRMGGATNHRMGLWDAAMIKDNHVAVAGGVGEAVRRAAEAGIERIILEVDRIDQIEPGLKAGATWLLLDNMDPETLRQAVAVVAGRVPTEASGGVTLKTIRAKAETGVSYISVGRLTQSAPAADIGLDFTLR